MRFLLRVAVSAAALAVATAVLPGIQLTAGSTISKLLTLVAVALIFGVINAFLKPIIKAIGCLFYILTLGLVALVVNALLLWLVSAVRPADHIQCGHGHHGLPVGRQARPGHEGRSSSFPVVRRAARSSWARAASASG